MEQLKVKYKQCKGYKFSFQIILVTLLTNHCISSTNILANATCKINVEAATKGILSGKIY